MKTRAVAILLLLLMLPLSPALADGGTTCHTSTDLGHAQQGCFKYGSETQAYIVEHSDHTFSIRLACATDNKLCEDTPTCGSTGHPGQVYNVFEDGTRLDWQACLTKREARHISGVTPGMVRHAFQRLSWPASELVVQPPKGRTLVNFDTNFYTANTQATTQVVTLLGQRVTIEATPVSYTWHFGTGDGDLTTSDPGAAYPDLEITHRYTRVGDVAPSVDTTYRGRYRVGDGAWRSIPDTLTVPGATVALEVLSATPHLVGY